MTRAPTRPTPIPAPRLTRASFGCLLMLVLLGSRMVPANTWDGLHPDLERGVKAAFLYKFLGFVQWPAGSFDAPDAPINIGVLGAEGVAAELARIVPGRNVDGRPLLVRRVKASDPLDGLHMLFVGRDADRALPRLSTPVQRQSVLLVCESADALMRGCAINFILSEGRIRFEVSPQAAENSGLKLSSRLLGVAHSVDGRKP